MAHLATAEPFPPGRVRHRGLTLRARLVVLVVLLALVLAVIAGFTVFTVHATSDALDQRLEVFYPAAASAGHLRSIVIDQEAGQRSYVITREETFLEPYQQAQADSAAQLVLLDRFARRIDGLTPALQRVRATLEAWRTLAAEPEIAVTRAGSTDLAARSVPRGEGKQLFDEVRRELDATQQVIDDASDANAAFVRSVQNRLQVLLVVGVGVVAGIVIVLLVVLRRWVTRPTDALLARVGRIAAGEFCEGIEGIEVTGPPEFVEIARAVDEMRRRIVAEFDQLERYNEALELEGPVITALRAELAPTAFLAPAGVEVAGDLLSAEGLLAGDFYDVLEVGSTDDGTVAVLLADVSGHGHEAGVLALRFKILIEAALGLGFEPGACLAWAADRLGDTGDMFLTCVVVVVRPGAGFVRYASAGHPSGVLVRQSRDAVIELRATGPVIGPFPGRWRTELVELDGPRAADEPRERAGGGDDGGTVVLCSDGVLEARSTDGALFGFDRFAALACGAGEVPEIVEACCAAARDHAGARLRDDVTVVALRWRGSDSRADATAIGDGAEGSFPG